MPLVGGGWRAPEDAATAAADGVGVVAIVLMGGVVKPIAHDGMGDGEAGHRSKWRGTPVPLVWGMP